MATIRTAIMVQDSMSSALRSMSNACRILVNNFEDMRNASSNTVDVQSLKIARNELNNTDMILRQTEEQMKKVNQESRRMPSGFESANSSAGSLLRTLMGFSVIQKGIGLVLGQVGSAIQRLDTMNNFPKVMSNLGISTEQAEASIQILSNGLKGLPTTLDSAASAVQRFTASNNSIGYSTKMFLALNNALLAGGQSTDIQTTALEQLSQAYSKGKPDMMEWKALQSAIPAQLQQIATAMNTTQTQLGEDLRNGKVSMNDFMNTIIRLNEEGANGFQSFAEQAKNATGGFATSIANMKSAITRGISDMITNINTALTECGLPDMQTMLVNFGSTMEVVLGNIGNFIGNVIILLEPVFNMMKNIADVVVNDWSIIAPIIGGIAGAILVYNMVTMAAAIATKIWEGAQRVFNAVMAMNPVMLTVIGIILLISVIYAVVAAINKARKASGDATKTSLSATGIICGAVNVVLQTFKNLGLVVANVALGLWEAMKACASNLGTAFHNAICNIKGWFYDMLSTALNVIGKICEELNKLPFVEFDYSNITDKANEYALKAAEMAGKKEDYVSIGDAFEKGMSTFEVFQDGWVADAYNSGYEWGAGLADKVSNMFSKRGNDNENKTFDPNSLDYSTPVSDNLNNIAGNTKEIADNTAEIGEEDLKYLIDIAERETINRFTTAEVKIEMNNNNTINGEQDLDGIAEGLATILEEKLQYVADGVHV